MAGALTGRPLKIQKKDLENGIQESAYQLAPAAVLATILAGAGGFWALGGGDASLRLGPALLVISLALFSHGASGGLFFKVLRRK